MRRIFVTAAVGLAAAALVAGCGAVAARTSAARPAHPASSARRERALAAWRRQFPWRGWHDRKRWHELTRRMKPGTGLPRCCQSPAFRRVVEAYGLADRPLSEWIEVLGVPEPQWGIPYHVTSFVGRVSEGVTGDRRLYSWRGSVAQVRRERPWQPAAPYEIPRIECEVVDVGPGCVMLSAGSRDGVHAGFRFTVHRGDRFLGTFQISAVFRDKSVGYRLLSGFARDPEIRPGDRAVTRVY